MRFLVDVPPFRPMFAAAALVAVAAIAPVVSVQADTPATISLSPHQALYTLSLKQSRGNVSVNNASGRILYNFSGNRCEGYTSDFRQLSELDVSEGNDITSDLRSSSWESADGKTYRFNIETKTNDEDSSLVDGVAERKGDAITVKLKQPVAKEFTIGADTIFPTEQVKRIIIAAREGKSLLELRVYDGSDGGEKIYNTFAVIGREIAADKLPADAGGSNDELKKLRRWPVTVSYYDSAGKSSSSEQTPVYAMSFELYDNGVSRALVLDYNDFVISGAMSKYDTKQSKPCKP